MIISDFLKVDFLLFFFFSTSAGVGRAGTGTGESPTRRTKGEGSFLTRASSRNASYPSCEIRRHVPTANTSKYIPIFHDKPAFDSFHLSDMAATARLYVQLSHLSARTKNNNGVPRIWRNCGRWDDSRRIEASRGLPLEEIYDRCATRGLIIGQVGTSRFNDLINSPVSGHAITGLCRIRLIGRTFYRQSFAVFPRLVAQRSGETSPTVTLISQIGNLPFR